MMGGVDSDVLSLEQKGGLGKSVAITISIISMLATTLAVLICVYHRRPYAWFRKKVSAISFPAKLRRIPLPEIYYSRRGNTSKRSNNSQPCNIDSERIYETPVEGQGAHRTSKREDIGRGASCSSASTQPSQLDQDSNLQPDSPEYIVVLEDNVYQHLDRGRDLSNMKSCTIAGTSVTRKEVYEYSAQVHGVPTDVIEGHSPKGTAPATDEYNTIDIGAGTDHSVSMNPGENVYNTLDANMGRSSVKKEGQKTGFEGRQLVKTLSAKFNGMDKRVEKQEPRKTAARPHKNEHAAKIESQVNPEPKRTITDEKPCPADDAFEGTGYELLQSFNHVEAPEEAVPKAKGYNTICVSEGISHMGPSNSGNNVYNSATGNEGGKDRFGAGKRIMKSIGTRFSSLRGIRHVRKMIGRAENLCDKRENDASCEGPIYHEPDTVDIDKKPYNQDAFESNGYDLIEAPKKAGDSTPNDVSIARSRSCPAPSEVPEDESGYALVSIGKP